MTDKTQALPLWPQDYNLLLDTDSYKLSHFLGYPEGVSTVYSYLESRGGRYPATIFFGLQRLLIEKLQGQVVTGEKIDEAETFAQAHGLPFNAAGWEHILNEHGGRLPVLIRAVPEGLLVPTHNALMTVENTDPAVPWLTSYLETLLLRDLWYGSTVATRIFTMKRGLKQAYDQTSDVGINPFSLLDFSSRGCAGTDANEIGGGAYLTCFAGSDSVPAVRAMNYYYDDDMSGFSVPATEHSIMCSWKHDGPETILALLAKMGRPGGILSIVADTWNVFEAAETFASLADRFKAAGVTAVFRPDSGHPDEVLPGVLASLEKGFGSTTNSKGYRVLDGVKVLWGDGVNEHTYIEPLHVAQAFGVSADSIIVASGGGLMQADMDRDTCKWAFKASEMIIDGEHVGISKNPITDSGKRSKTGRFSLFRRDDGSYVTQNSAEGDVDEDDLLDARFLNGELIEPTSLAQIRERIDAQL